MMGETSTGPVALANNVQQGQSFLEATKHSVCGEIPASQPLQMRRPKLIEGELSFIFTDLEVKRLVEDFRFALVLKFLSFRRNIDLVRAAIAKTWGLREVPVVSHMDASNVLEKRNVTEIELGRDRNMDEDRTVASKTSGIEIAKLGREEDQGVKENAEELQEDSRDHDNADEAITMSDKEVEGMVEKLGNIRDCILDSEQRANGHLKKTVHKRGWKTLDHVGDEVHANLMSKSNQQITCLVIEGNYRMLVSFTYTKCTAAERRLLWLKLEEVNYSHIPWVVVGDFNSIRNNSERHGGRPRPMGAMEDFNQFIDNCGLMEIRQMVGNLILV
ncbi:unnamed protein product [Fraxinus pennsylvanica]|uniref:Endonuclease/exonuclease/phosphatase domain-containing protein n=1 Tax=Fraxinus pennsylvanica TaxID=56036 RepID=A0AAD2E774_9LAMI|nr:unnamed protein product [Fraxinus pennsylvanica]